MNIQIDMSRALGNLGGDEELLNGLVAIFLDDCPRLLSDVHRAVTGQNSEGLERAAHTFRGSAANFAAKEVCEILSRLETMGRSGNLTGAEAASSELEPAAGQLRNDLSALMTRAGDA